MDPRKWFYLEEKPQSRDWEKAVVHCPPSEYRCPTVMRAFLAGRKTGFRLTDGQGRPTDTLRAMVAVMGTQLCQVPGLSAAERRRFTGLKGGQDDPVFRDRWFIREITTRLRHERGTARSAYGWPWYMFKTDKNPGLMYKYGSEAVNGGRQWGYYFLAVCPPDWHLTSHVYEGLWRWHGDHLIRKAWDSYSYLNDARARAAREEVTATGGHAEMVHAAGPA